MYYCMFIALEEGYCGLDDVDKCENHIERSEDDRTPPQLVICNQLHSYFSFNHEFIAPQVL